MNLLAELRRRNVFKVGAAYLVVVWLAVQAVSIGFPAFDAPPWALRIFILVALLGFPVALVLAWVFEATPEGVKFDASAKGSKRVIGAAVVLVLFSLGWYFLGQPAFRKGDVAATSTASGSTAGGGVQEKSIAVLPFVDMSQARDQEFFSDGIAEELLNQLSQFPDLMVAARTSAFQFKGKNLDVAEIGRKLNVAHVLEGSVRKEGGHLRITAQLIKTATGYHLWSQSFERDAGDVFKVQDEIATAIARALEAKLSGHLVSMSAPKTVDPAAYADYLQARSLVAARLGESTTLAIAAFDRAIARDRDYSAAYAGRAFAFTLVPGYTGSMPISVAFTQALASAEKALQLDPGNAEAYLVRGAVHLIRFKDVAAREDTERALALAPGNVDVLNFVGDYYLAVGNLRAAERMKRQAMALDPLSFVHPMNLADILRSEGRFEEARSMGEQAIRLGGGRTVQVSTFWSYLRLGNSAKARELVESICRTEDANCLIVRIALAAAADQSELDLTKARLAATQSTWLADGVFATDVATLYADYTVDISRATAAVAQSLQGEDYQVVSPLLYGPKGARLPEEVSRDSEWLAAWNSPKVREIMTAYRANLASFRSGQ